MRFLLRRRGLAAALRSWRHQVAAAGRSPVTRGQPAPVPVLAWECESRKEECAHRVLTLGSHLLACPAASARKRALTTPAVTAPPLDDYHARHATSGRPPCPVSVPQSKHRPSEPVGLRVPLGRAVRCQRQGGLDLGRLTGRLGAPSPPPR